MRKMLAEVPLPISGAALAFATMGNMLAEYHPGIRIVCGFLAVLIIVAVTLKIFLDFSGFQEALKNPLILTTFPTYDMCLMVLSTYLKPLLSIPAMLLWLCGLVIHFICIGIVTNRHILKFEINKVFASYFVTYVGIVVGSITGPAHGLQSMGQILFYIGFVLYILLLPLVIYRVAKLKEMPEMARPSCVILCAPGSLCLAGYLSSFTLPSPGLLTILTTLCFILVPVGYGLFFVTNKKIFYPSYAAYTFPYVISAFAMKKLMAAIETTGIFAHTFLTRLLPPLVTVMIIIAVASTVYVFVRYLNYLIGTVAAGKDIVA